MAAEAADANYLRNRKHIKILYIVNKAVDGTQPIEAQVGAEASEPQDVTDFRNTFLKVFLDKEVEALKMKLSADNLQRVRAEGKNVQQHVTEAMLSCRSAVDRLLCDLGPGPIVQASDADPDPAGIRPDTVLTDTYMELD